MDGENSKSKDLKLPNWMLQAHQPKIETEIHSCPNVFHDLANECEQILIELDKCDDQYKIISLDLDWPSLLSNTLAKSSSIHLCTGIDSCCLFSVRNLTSLPLGFICVLKHPKTRLVGKNIVNDILKLREDFKIDINHILSHNLLLPSWDQSCLSCKHKWKYSNNTEKLNQVEHKIEEKKEILTYNGKITYCKSFVECAEASEHLLKIAEKSDKFVIGFDLEWPFTFKTGAGKVALMQLNPNLEECYLFHLSEFKILPKCLILLLKHKNVFLTGLNITNDIKKLSRDFKTDLTSVIKNNLIELTTFANEKLSTNQRWSLDRLVFHLVNKVLLKTPSVRMSKWSDSNLTKAQITYAATDSYASLLCYKVIEDKSKNDTTN